MKWEDFRRSDNIDDRRGDGESPDGSGGMFGGGGGGGGLGVGTMIVLGIIGYMFGIDPRILIGGAEMFNNFRGGGAAQERQIDPARKKQVDEANKNDPMRQFVSAVLAQNEDVWNEVLPKQKGVRYQNPTLVLFSGYTRSACGAAQSAMGPFYCPLDRKVYLDMSFFNDMKRKLGGGGDFAYAYVISHEIGHHVENLLGILPKVQEAQQNASSKAEANNLSVRVELMADCLAGVWAANANQKWQVLEQGDIEKAMNTAAAIGDDRLQQQGRGYAVPDSFTHGSSAQRQQWFTQGLKTGQVDACNTFRRASSN